MGVLHSGVRDAEAALHRPASVPLAKLLHLPSPTGIELIMTVGCHTGEKCVCQTYDVEVGKWDASVMASYSDRGGHTTSPLCIRRCPDSWVNRRRRSVTVRPCPVPQMAGALGQPYWPMPVVLRHHVPKQGSVIPTSFPVQRKGHDANGARTCARQW
jgi:hypothetical protein